MQNKYGLIGKKLSHSYSPIIHSIILKEIGCEGTYELIETENESEIGKKLNDLKNSGYKGLNVTIPYKTSVMPFLNRIYEPARCIGAVNTILSSENHMYGYNTDYDGFLMMLSYNKVSLKGKKAAILGTGGSSKAVAKALSDGGISDIIMVSRAQNEVAGFKSVSYEKFETAKIPADIIINCTPVGMHPNADASPVSKDPVSKAECVIDLIYNPDETLLMKTASDLGIKNFNGLYMLVGQAVRAQEIWNNTAISNETVNKIYEEIRKILTLNSNNK